MKTKLETLSEWVACPQFGDDHYGELGGIAYNKRKLIKDFTDYVTSLEAHDREMTKRYLCLVKYLRGEGYDDKEINAIMEIEVD